MHKVVACFVDFCTEDMNFGTFRYFLSVTVVKVTARKSVTGWFCSFMLDFSIYCDDAENAASKYRLNIGVK